MKKISYIIVSRNDSYCGDSIGRLTNTLNHTGQILFDNGVLDESEVVLVDWASPNSKKTLKDVLKLNQHIKKILKIVITPKDIANKYQKDSPFSEVHAMNVGFRRMSSKYFARIDNDTLIGHRWIKWFYEDRLDLGYEIHVAFSGRRNLSEQESNKNVFKKLIDNDLASRQIEICHSHNHYSRLMPNGGIYPFYGGAVGVMLVERELYEKHKGFNEDLVYMNNMDTEFLNRIVVDDYDIYNLSLCTDADFYHQHHVRSDGAAGDTTQPHAKEKGVRKTNEDKTRYAIMVNNNTDDWGLNSEDLEIFTYKEFQFGPNNNGDVITKASLKKIDEPIKKGKIDIIHSKGVDKSEIDPLILDFNHRNKNVIYIIDNRPDEKDFKNPGYDNMAWSDFTLQSLQNYANTINADLEIVNKGDFPTYWENISKYSFSFYQKSTFIKALLLHKFLKSDYDKFLLLDLDMVVHKDAPSIFDFYKTNHFVIGEGFDQNMVQKNEIFLKKYFKILDKEDVVYDTSGERNIPKYNLNLGTYIMSRKIVESLCEHIPQEDEFIEFLKTFNLINNPVLKVGKNREPKDFIDQDLFSYAYICSGVLADKSKIAWEWNANWQACFQKHKPFNICHLTGKDGKQFLLDNLNNPEVLEKLNVQS